MKTLTKQPKKPLRREAPRIEYWAGFWTPARRWAYLKDHGVRITTGRQWEVGEVIRRKNICTDKPGCVNHVIGRGDIGLNSLILTLLRDCWLEVTQEGKSYRQMKDESPGYVHKPLSKRRKQRCYRESAEGRSRRLSRERHKRKKRRGTKRISL